MFGKKETLPDSEYFALYDAKTDSYNLPMLATNKFDMVRQVENLMKDPAQAQNTYVTNAEDFQLFKIGTYDKKTGTIKGHIPEHIANLHEIRASLKQQN